MKIYKVSHNKIHSLEVTGTKKGYRIAKGEKRTIVFNRNSFFYPGEVALTPLKAVEKAIDLNFMFWNMHKKELDRLDKERKSLRILMIDLKK